MRVSCDVAQVIARNNGPSDVEAYLADASGFRWQIVEKTAVFHEYELLDGPLATHPTTASLTCRVLTDHGGPTVTIVLPDVGDRVYEVDRSTLLSS